MQGVGSAQGKAKGGPVLWSGLEVQVWARVRCQATRPLVGMLFKLCAWLRHDCCWNWMMSVTAGADA